MSDRAYAKKQAPQKTWMNSSSKHTPLQHTWAYAQDPIATDEYSTYRNEPSPLAQAHRPLASSSTSRQNKAPQETNTFLNTTSNRTSDFGHHFGQIPLYPTHRAVLQKKLTVNQPGDVYEQEADHAAEQVMRMVAPSSSIAPTTPDDDESKDKPLMRTEASGIPAAETTPVPPIVHEVLTSNSGQALDGATRAFMEPRFGHDFSNVRVHTNERAAESAHSVSALAYTVGSDVVFGRGQYAPTTSKGRRLLAHELTHTVQQGFTLPLSSGSATKTISHVKRPAIQFQRTSKTHKPLQANTLDIFNAIKKRNADLAALISPNSLAGKAKPPLIKGRSSDREVEFWEVQVNSYPGIVSRTDENIVMTKRVVEGVSSVVHTITITWGTLFNLQSEQGQEFLKQTSSEQEAVTLLLAEPLFHELLHARIIIERNPQYAPQQHSSLFQGYEEIINIANKSPSLLEEKSQLLTQIGAMIRQRNPLPDERTIQTEIQSIYEFLVHEKFDSQIDFAAFGKNASNSLIAEKYLEPIIRRITLSAVPESSAWHQQVNILRELIVRLYNKIDQIKSSSNVSNPSKP